MTGRAGLRAAAGRLGTAAARSRGAFLTVAVGWSPRVVVPAGLAAAVAITGCGSAAPHRAGASGRLSGAEPAVAPPLTRAPAGRVVTVGAAAEGIVTVPSVGLVAVAVRNPDRIALLSIRSGDVVADVRIAGPARHLTLDGPHTLLVPEAPVDHLLELPLADVVRRHRDPISHHDIVTRHVPGARSLRTGSLPHEAVALDGRVFVADEFGHAVSVFSGARTLPSIRGFTQPGGGVAVGGRVALVDVGADTVTLIDPRTLRPIDRLHAGTGLTHDAAGPGDRLYVNDTRGGGVFVLASRPRLRVIDRLVLPGRPYGIAVDPVRHHVWVTQTGLNRVVELDVSRPRPRIVASFPTVRQPNTVAVDPRTGEVYVAGAAAGVVEEFDPTRPTAP